MPGWYIILYHDVSWEETPFVRHIGGSCPPDVFRDHVQTCAELGRLVTVQEGLERLLNNDITAPLFSFWFDDGFIGIRKYAAPILEEFGITGATSICSRFLSRTEMFWRFKLSYLQSIDAGRHLRARLRRFGYSGEMLVREFTMDQFSPDLLGLIDHLYDEATSLATREDAFRIFETPAGLLELLRHGWIVANHSAAHYPVGKQHLTHMLLEQFEECDRWIQQLTGRESSYWVLPFDRDTDAAAIDAIREHEGNKTVVQVGDMVNLSKNYLSTKILYRINAPANDRMALKKTLCRRYPTSF